METGEGSTRPPTLRESISFHGHRLIRSTHPTTIEVTEEEHLTENGDCIIGVGAEKGCAGLSDGLKTALRSGSATVRLSIVVGGERFGFAASGDPGLRLSHPHDVVIRRSGFVSERTLALRATASARDIPRTIVSRLRDPRTAGVLEIEVVGA